MMARESKPVIDAFNAFSIPRKGENGGPKAPSSNGRQKSFSFTK